MEPHHLGWRYVVNLYRVLSSSPFFSVISIRTKHTDQTTMDMDDEVKLGVQHLLLYIK